jgi:hypothetical protein
LVPLHTVLIVGGSWILLLVLAVWNYRRQRDEDGE